MTTNPNTTNVRQVYGQGSSEVRQHLTAALGSLAALDIDMNDAFDQLDRDIARMRSELMQLAQDVVNNPKATNQDAQAVLAADAALNQAQADNDAARRTGNAQAPANIRARLASIFDRSTRPATHAPAAVTNVTVVDDDDDQAPAPAAAPVAAPAQTDDPVALWFSQNVRPLWPAENGTLVPVASAQSVHDLNGRVTALEEHAGREVDEDGNITFAAREYAARANWVMAIIFAVVTAIIGWSLSQWFHWGFASLATPFIVIAVLVAAAIGAAIPWRQDS